MKNNTIKFILSIDTEEEWDWNGPFPGADAKVTNINELPAFHAYCHQVGIRPTYFTDYAVLQSDHSVKIMKALLSQGNCEIGAHLHPWVNPPFYGETGERESHVVNLPLEQVEEKLKSLLLLMQQNLGVQPKSFRSGRWGINGDCLKLLIEGGINIDSSIYPFFKNDYFSCETAPVTPYWPEFSNTNNNSDEQREIFEIPVTVGYNNPSFELAHKVHSLLSSTPFSWVRLNGIFWHLRLLRKINLSPELHSAADMIRLVRACLKQDHKVLHMNLHSSSLIEGVTGLSTLENARETICEKITEVIHYIKEHKVIEFQTISETRNELINNYHSFQD